MTEDTRRRLRVELTEPQINALRAAVDNHGQYLMDNEEGDPRMRRQLRSLDTGWARLEAAWAAKDKSGKED